jgi:CO dehydrogenase maturation factor
MLAVVEPYYKSLETGRRMAVLAKDLGLDRVALVANKLRDERDEEAVVTFAERNGLDIAGRIPFDDLFVDAERAGVAPLDLTSEAAAAPGVAAIARLAAQWGIDGRA